MTFVALRFLLPLKAKFAPEEQRGSTGQNRPPDRLDLMFRRFVCFLAAACAASAAVRSVQITERTPVLDGAYERIVGRVYISA